ncbi:cytochrome-c oxidase, cbb3-type subunit III [Algiphilus sp.]|uniref:cytochrome-c oxidase, cbb3-type subunit III n=1 Tax=Algiphilus sp. TaxID=1872431 RepID=UPI001CA63302|nr:cytochrome-c oxidase, cbb3-type subunit III [Algiphilus sp.]MBY8965845.1 cytochrome-c oxidase, cbb3-type subunit III [Algiphilus acroporae]MCI5061810.1 cytochrome-c oxidase, cbb3-type subunit III [Algiphilus sp.]MCI5104524.1 cytochrome-c oxidase, cbb3-type subunit III [Algiphilus sp.]
MSTFWSVTVTVVVLLNILACVWLLIWTSKKQPGEVAEGAEKDHVWDEDLRELNNPLPRWWLHTFILSIVFALGYLVAYPGLGNFPGLLGWSQHKQHDERLAEVQEQRQSFYAQFEGKSVTELAGDPAARSFGSELYSIQCAGCHGVNAQGAVGFPNLRDDVWIWGGDAQAIHTTIAKGRQAVMPQFYATLDQEAVPALIEYVRNWDNADLRGERLALAQQTFQRNCMACHGPDGQGNPLMGAPNLRNGEWLYGGSEEAVRQSILFGRNGNMPAFGNALSALDIDLLAAYVLGLNEGGAE